MRVAMNLEVIAIERIIDNFGGGFVSAAFAVVVAWKSREIVGPSL